MGVLCELAKGTYEKRAEASKGIATAPVLKLLKDNSRHFAVIWLMQGEKMQA